jgi:tetratricopeptide (TPR) repeat protein
MDTGLELSISIAFGASVIRKIIGVVAKPLMKRIRSAPAGGHNTVPRQVPAPVRFVNRDAELAALDQVRTGHGDRFGLVLITGPAGVGKSALAGRWVTRARRWFPDGQLYAELGANDPAGPPPPGEVLGGFLRALGVPSDHVPARITEQAGLFRSITSGKRLVLLLDNAASAAQVRHLLPGGSGSTVVVTARARLGGLVGEGARLLNLEPLHPPAATALLRATLGDSRLDDSDAAEELVQQCAGLPIALTITAARLASHPAWPIRRAVTQLADARNRLTRMSTSEGSVTVTFDLSYQSLGETAARCYRALGLHPGRRPGLPVIAVALDASPSEVAPALDELVESSLADETPDERYQLHDLILLHAQQQARSDPDREVMADRIAEWYLSGTRAADLLLTPYRRRPAEQFSYLSPSAVTFTSRDEALEWLDRERTNLVAAVVTSATRAPEIAWRIAYGMWPLFHYGGHHHDRLTVDRVGVDCARQLGNRDFEARMLRRLAFAHFDLGELAEARELFQESLDLCQDLHDQHGIAAAVEGLGQVALGQGQHSLAADLFTRQLAHYEDLGEQRRAALATLNLGIVDNAAGRPAQAARYVLRAREMLTALGNLDPYNTARTYLELGKALTGTGEHAAAAQELDRALHDMRHLGSVRGQAQAHHALGVLAIACGKSDDARAHLDQALDAYERLGDPEAAEIRRMIQRRPPADPGATSAEEGR